MSIHLRELRNSLDDTIQCFCESFLHCLLCLWPLSNTRMSVYK